MVTVVSEDQQNSQIVVATHVGIAPGGMIFVNGPANSGLVRIDPVTGAQFLSVQSLPNITSIQGSLDGDLFLGWTAAASGTVVRFDPGTETIAGTVSSLGPLRGIVAMAVVPAPVTPPVVTCSVQTELLWPPNHELFLVGFGVSVQHDAPTTLSLAVYSDEDDLKTGSGNHAPDAVDVALRSLLLRAESSGLGDGRVYLIVATASDAFGNVGFDCCTVVVPRSQSPQSVSGVLAQAALAEASCGKTGSPPAGFVTVGER